MTVPDALCRHPTPTCHWDPLQAVLRCRACGRPLGLEAQAEEQETEEGARRR